MTKILAIGDFHGQFSKKLISKIKKEKPDIILSPGDFCGDKLLRKLIFKYFYGKSDDEVPNKIKNQRAKLEKSSFSAGEKIINKIKSLNIPVYAIRGNWDPTPFGFDIGAKINKSDKNKAKKFSKLQNKNFQFVDFREIEFDNFILVGGASSSSPQKLDKGMVNNMVKKHKMSKKEATSFVSHFKKDWNFRRENYEIMFEKAIRLKKQTGKKIIFLTHNCPYRTKLDKIKHGLQKRKHYGSYQEKLLIKKYQPDFVICGHMHENFGVDKIGKSIIYNTGSAMDGKFKILKI